MFAWQRTWRRFVGLSALVACLLAAACGGPTPRAAATRQTATSGRGRATSVYGDLNGNGAIDAADATKVLRVVVALDARPADLSTMDFNGNGAVDAADATKVLRVVVKLDNALVLPSIYAGPTKELVVDSTHGAVHGSVQKRLFRGAGRAVDAEAPTVWVTSGGHNFYQSTDTQGGYGFGSLAPVASLPITAAAPGYGQTGVTAPIVANTVTTAPDITLVADPLDATGALKGIVFDAKGKPVNGASIRIPNSNYTYNTGADGYFVFVQLVPGTYNLTCDAQAESLQQTFLVTAGETKVGDFHLGNVLAQPKVSATVDKGSATVGQTFNFVGTAVPGTGGTLARYTWDFGDGTPTVSSTFNGNAAHAYTQPGTYRATVSVTDVNDNVGTAWQQLTVLATPGLTVTLEPAAATAAGATWAIDGGAAQTTGTTLTGLAAGEHTLHFNAATGYTPPADQTVTVVSGQSQALSGVYLLDGSVTVSLAPAAAVTAGARWTLDGDGGHASGATVSGVTVGSHKLSFSTIAGYTRPTDQTVNVTAGAAATASGTYVTSTGSLKVTLAPAAAVTAGARWTLDSDSTPHASGETLAGLAPGSHTVHGVATAGYTVADVSATVTVNTVTNATLTYVVRPVLRAGVLAAGGGFSVALNNAGQVVAWGLNNDNQCSVPALLTGVQSLAAGISHTVAVTSAGIGWAWGDAYLSSYLAYVDGTNISQAAVGAGAWGYNHVLLLKRDGSISAAGNNAYLQLMAPSSVFSATAVSAGSQFSVALYSTGTVRAWGRNDAGQLSVPAGLTGVTAISAGAAHTLALKSDGTVVAWGYNGGGRCDVPYGLSGVIAIAAGGGHSLALKADGTVVAWGDNTVGQCSVPTGLKDVVALAAGWNHSLAATASGQVVGWGDDSTGACTPPAGLTVAVASARGR